MQHLKGWGRGLPRVQGQCGLQCETLRKQEEEEKEGKGIEEGRRVRRIGGNKVPKNCIIKCNQLSN